jgi:hypothetical protein
VNLWAVIPSKDRSEMLVSLCGQLLLDGVRVVVIDTGYEPELVEILWHGDIQIIRDVAEPPNISRWWNLGLDHIKKIEGEREHVVAILNDDIVIPEGFVQKLAPAVLCDDNVAA